MATYSKTHPWLSFRWEPGALPPAAWMALGAVAARCQHLTALSLPPDEAALIEYAAVLRGVLANASLDGNTLSEEQVDRLFEGSLELPPSQRYLQVEIDALVKAARWSAARGKSGATELSPWTLQLLHTQLLTGVSPDLPPAPGTFRGTAGAGVPPAEIVPALERLDGWLNSGAFTPGTPAEHLAYGIIRALLAHAYLLWIKPFEIGNGRVARTVEHLLLLAAGVPALAAHQLTVAAARARAAYERRASPDAEHPGDIVVFITAQLLLFAEGLDALTAEVQQVQHQALWQKHLREVLDPAPEGPGARHIRLMLDLSDHRVAVPIGRIPDLSPELARTYARLNPKTLQRDLALLQQHGLVQRTPEGFLARPDVLRALGARGR